MNVLKERLEFRNTEKKEDIHFRLENAERELKAIRLYDYVLVNDNVEKCFNNIKEIISKYLKRI